LAGVLAIGATLFYVFVYTLWLKRTSRQNIVIGGAAGAAPVLVGWAAVTNSLSWSAVVLFVVIFLWTPPHFWALAIRHSDEYRAAAVPMLPVVATPARTVRTMGWYTIAVTLASFVLTPLNDMGVIYSVYSSCARSDFRGDDLRTRQGANCGSGDESVHVFHLVPHRALRSGNG